MRLPLGVSMRKAACPSQVSVVAIPGSYWAPPVGISPSCAGKRADCNGRRPALPAGSPSPLALALAEKKGAHGGNMVSPVLRGPSGPAANIVCVTVRLASISLVLGATLADAGAAHELA